MKRLLGYIIAAISCCVIAIIAPSCSDPESQGPDPSITFDEQTLALLGQTKEIVIPPEGAPINFVFTATADWSVTISNSAPPSWLFIRPMNGVAGKGDLSLSASASDENKSAVVTITCGSVTETFKVTMGAYVEVESISIKCDQDPLEMVVGDTKTVTATLSPSSLKDPEVVWTCEPDGIVELSYGSAKTECAVKGIAEGTATLKASCYGKEDAITVKVSEPFVPQGEKASYEDFLGIWYVKGTLGTYFQHFHQIDPYEINYCVRIEQNSDGTGYLIKEWETPAHLADALKAYYSPFIKDEDGVYRDDIYSFYTDRYLDMTLDAQYDEEYGYMTVKVQEKYRISSGDQSVVFGLSTGDVGGTHLVIGEGDSVIGNFWKQPDGTIKVLGPAGSPSSAAMGYMNYYPGLYIAKTIYNNLPDFPLTMTRVEGAVTGVSINGITKEHPYFVSVEAGESFRAEAILEPSTADPSHLEWYSEDPTVATIDAEGKIQTLKEGSTYIYAYADGAWAKGLLAVTSPLSFTPPEYAVDLGLSVKWAPFNVGAAEPKEYGGYFAWAEIEPKKEFTTDNYKYYVKGRFDKDGNSSPTGAYTGKYTKYTDYGNNFLDEVDDVAYQVWGSEWRLPTKEEVEELVENCVRTKETIGEIEGVRFTGPSGGSIFIPCNGYMRHDEPAGVGENINIWTNCGVHPYGADFGNCTAYVLSVLSRYTETQFDDADVQLESRICGLGVRPVMK